MWTNININAVMSGKIPKKKSKKDVQHICKKHDFTISDISKIQENLLNWYDKNQRVLPWRDIAKKMCDPNKRGYAIWVSEIMLQQTQVATVISYFNKWMEKWPTVSHLASATLEDVNTVWAGLGYYSRAKRLHEGAKIIMEKMDGAIPQTVDELMNQIPGIGLYSASAIASVAFQKPVGVVDGNVIRVLSRARIIGAHVTKSGVRDHLWYIANKIVSIKRPGDFNQALMELGAVVCTPQNPKCSDCPINSSCTAYMMAQKACKIGTLDGYLKKNLSETKLISKNADVPDIENASCSFCMQPSVWKKNPQVTAFPCKVEKKSSRIEHVGVIVIKKNNCFLMTKRPDKGLLAGLWEFPSVISDLNEQENSSAVNSIRSAVNSILSYFDIPPSVIAKKKYIGDVMHIFSHIRTTYVVEYLELNSATNLKNMPKEISWWTEEEIRAAAVSTAMKKVLNAVQSRILKVDKTSSNVPTKKRKRKCDITK